MGYIILAFCIAAGVTYLAIPVIINIAREKKLVDMPDARKLHKNPIPSLGGIGIFGGFSLAILLSWPQQYTDLSVLQYVMAATLIIFFLGMKDDIVIISPLKKFIGQLLAAWIVVYKCKLQIVGFGGILGIHALPNAVSLALTYLAIVLITNSFNLIDGVDGLSGTLGFISAAGFTLYFFSFGLTHLGYALIASAMAGALAAFLIFNVHPAKIFMGDTGSLLIGLLNAFLIIKFINISISETSETVYNRLGLYNSPVIGLAFLTVPLFDTIRVFAFRILKGRSPFSPDRNHIHHILLDKGLNHNQVTFTLAITSLFIIGISYICAIFTTITASIIIVAAVTVLLFGIIYLAPKRKMEKATSKKKADTSKSKVVNLSRDVV